MHGVKINQHVLVNDHPPLPGTAELAYCLFCPSHIAKEGSSLRVTAIWNHMDCLSYHYIALHDHLQYIQEFGQINDTSELKTTVIAVLHLCLRDQGKGEVFGIESKNVRST